MDSKERSILRLARTLPTKQSPGVGLHCYKFSNLIAHPTIIFYKRTSEQVQNFSENVKLKSVQYKDLSFQASKIGFFQSILILITKAWGEINMIFSLLAERKKFDVELIHVHSMNFLLSGIAAKYYYRRPLVVNFGGTDLVRVKRSKILKWLVKFADGVLYVSKSMNGDLGRIYPPEKLFYMGNGVDLTLFTDKGFRRRNHLLAVGNLRWQKDYETMLMAFAQVNLHSPNFRLIVAGDGPDREALKCRAKSLGLSDSVDFIGVVDRNELVDMLNRSFLFIMTSVSEGLPKAAIEAVATGTPIVVTDAGDCSVVAQDVGLVVSPSRPVEFANAVIKLIENPELYRQLKGNCSNARTRYSWDQMVSVVEQCYEFVLKKNDVAI